MSENLELNVSLDSLSFTNDTDVNQYIKEVLNDYETCVLSREVSLIGRREVLTGKAKFGILGDGKEVPQVAFPRCFKKAIGAQAIIATKLLCFLWAFLRPKSFSLNFMPIVTMTLSVEGDK